jgi:molybdopterin/thiamine biosynthesis adenylyltransferase
MDEAALALAKGADILVGCVDNHGARLILNQLAIRYLIPLVDGGSGIKQASNHTPLSAGGQVQVVLPGIGCLECRGFIDMRRATFDLAPPGLQMEERAHGYGLYEPVPTVIFLNGVIGSAMVAEIVFLLTGGDVKLPKPVPPISLYSAFDRSLLAMESHESPDCPTCGSEGVLGVGDLAAVHSAAFASTVSSVAEDIPQNPSSPLRKNKRRADC